MNQTEIEIKCLLGSQENADIFLEHLEKYGIDMSIPVKPQRQLNHYFAWWEIMSIYDHLSSSMPIAQQEQLHHICMYGRNHSVRTRSILPWDHTLLVIKSSTWDDSSHNGVTRLEFEYHFPEMSLEELDRIILNLGWEYLSKWSRIRTNYHVENITISLDQNAWYGYVAELETMLEPGEKITDAESRIRVFMDKLGAHELSQEKIEQMFAHYNQNWADYYGTSRTFDMDSNGQVIRYGFDQ